MRSYIREGVKGVLLERLVLKNFKRFKEQEILFRDGITGIIGNNGTGKSSLVEAILFALYGLSGTGIKPEFIVSSFATPRERCEIRLDFQVHSHEYSVVRVFRKGNTTHHEVKLFGNKKLLAQSVNEVEREMVRLTGMDARDFKNTIYAGQRDLIMLLESRPGERKEWFTRALRLDDLKDKSQAFLKERIDVTERKEALLQGELDGLKKMIDEGEIQKSRSTVSELRHTLARYTEILGDLNKERASLQAELAIQLEEYYHYLRLTERLEKVKKSLVTSQQRQVALQAQLDDLFKDREEFERLRSIEDTYIQARNTLEQERGKKKVYDQLIQERKVLEVRTANLNEQLVQVKQGLEQVQLLDRERATLLQSIRERSRCPDTIPDESIESYIRTFRDQLTEQIGGLQEIMEDAARRREELLKGRDNLMAEGPDGKCPLCHQRLGDHYHQIQNDYEGQLVAVMKEAEETCSHLEEMEAERENLILLLPLIDEIHRYKERLRDRLTLQAELQRLNLVRESLETEHIHHTQELHQLSFNEDDFRLLEQRIRDLEQMHEKFQILGRKIAPLVVLEQQVTTVTHDIQEMTREKGILEQELGQLIDNPQRVHHLQEAIAQVQEHMTAVEKDRSRDLERLTKTEEMIRRYTDMERRTVEISRTLTLMEEELRLLRLTRTTIADFVVYLMQVVRSQIELYTGDILSEITGGRYGRVLLDGDFIIRVSDLDDDYPIERFSGGEQDDIAVALRIALSRYLAELHQIHDSTFLIFDEIFGSQDEERRNNLLRALRTQESHFPQIILISHIPEIQEEFATTLLVELGGDMMSTVREVS